VLREAAEQDIKRVETTTIGGRSVPVTAGPKTVIKFAGGRNGPQEAGDYEFWSAITSSGLSLTGRALAGGDPGERFRRTESSKGDQSSWETMERDPVQRVRPALRSEVERWINDKTGDAPHAQGGEVGGTAVRVEKQGDRYVLVDA
jgi:hypothetical protein